MSSPVFHSGRLRAATLLCLHVAAWSLSDASRAADNWPRFRGPNADGVAPDNAGLPTKWTTTENVKWVADVPGWGWSCPIVWGERVFLTSVVSDEESLTPSKGLYLGEGVRDPAKGIHHWLVHCFDPTRIQRTRPKVAKLLREHAAIECPVNNGANFRV